MSGHALGLPSDFVYAQVDNGYRANLFSESDVALWVRLYGEKTMTSWRVKFRKTNPSRYVCRKVFVCHHTGLRRVTPEENRRGKSKNTDCKAEIDIYVKLTTGNTKKKDKYIKDGLPAVIAINDSHNHELDTAEALSGLVPSEETRSIFESYFSDGCGIREAMNFHQTKLALDCPESGIEMGSANLNPKYRTVQAWYLRWKKHHLKTHPGDGVIEDNNDNMLKQLPDLGIVKTEPIDPDDIPIGANSTNLVASTSMAPILSVFPVLTDVEATPASILPDTPAPENIAATPIWILPGIHPSTNITATPIWILPNIPAPANITATPSAILPDVPSSTTIAATTSSAILPDVPRSTDIPKFASAILPDLPIVASDHVSANLSANDSAAKRAKLKRKSAEILKSPEEFDETSPSPPENWDELLEFGEYVLTKLRSFKDRRNQVLAQDHIASILLEWERKDLRQSNGTSTS